MTAKLRERLKRFYHQASPYYLSWKDKAVGILLAVFFFSLYLFTCSHGPNIAGDTPELIGASYSLGVPHPPGYPLYTMLGYLFTRIPMGSIAFRANFSSVVYHSLCLFVFYVVAMKITRNRAASAIATVALGFSPLFWFYSLVAEVFPLNDFFVVLLLYAALRTRDRWLEGKTEDSMRSIALLAFLCGLSLSNHHTVVLLFPALVIIVLYPLFAALRRLRYLLTSAAAFLFGLLPYVYLPLRASSNPYINFQDPSTLGNFIKVITRQYYGTSRLWKGPEASHRLDMIFEFIKNLGQQAHVLGIALGVLGIFYLAAKKRGDFYPLFAALILAGIVFPLMANVKITSVFLAATLERFFLLPLVIFLLFVACGAAAVLQWLKEKVSLLKVREDIARGLLWVFLLVLALPFLLPATTTAEAVSLNYDPLGNTYIKNLLASVEEGSVVLLQGDIHIQLLKYHKTCVEPAKKIHFIIEPFLSNDWYVKTVRKWNPDLDYPHPADVYHTEQTTLAEFKANFVRYLIEHNPQVPAFYINIAPRYLKKDYKLVPWGILYKILPKDAEIDYRAYYQRQLDYWKRFDQQGIDYRFYSGSRREVEMAPHLSLFLYEAGKLLRDNLSKKVAIHFFNMAYDIYPFPDLAKDLGDLYAQEGKPFLAYRYYGEARGFYGFAMLLKMEEMLQQEELHVE